MKSTKIISDERVTRLFSCYTFSDWIMQSESVAVHAKVGHLPLNSFLERHHDVNSDVRTCYCVALSGSRCSVAAVSTDQLIHGVGSLNDNPI